MWTPKRILLLAAGFLLFFTTYVVYDHFLGGIDGLPELPPEFLTDDTGPQEIESLPPRPAPRAEAMLIQAFGQDCKEIRERWDKLEIRSKGMVLAFGDFKIEEGRVRFAPLSLAIFGKTIPGKFPEINTVRADVAYLTFDKPVATVTDMTNRKIVAGELVSNIHVKHNRRTPQINDDIFIDIPHGPVYYRENQQRAWIDKEAPPSPSAETRPHLWTTDYVILEDHQSRPKPVRVTAKGMDLFLARSQPDAPAGSALKSKAKSDSISGLDQVILRASVDMRLYVDSGSGFLSPSNTRLSGDDSSPRNEKSLVVETKANGALAEKSEVTITTQGPFNYVVATDTAKFDVPISKPDVEKTYAEHVVVTRFSKPPGDAPSFSRFHEVIGTVLACSPSHSLLLSPIARQWPEDSSPLEDRILCNHLELKFQRKSGNGQQAPRDDHAPDLEIESAHALGGQVVLTSDAENLVAEGNDFYYNALTKTTILKGTPKADQTGLEQIQKHGTWVIDKNGNKIGVRELHLIDQKGAQQASGKGPGEIYLFDKATGKYPLHAKWAGSFNSTREGPYELITLIGGAEFRDDEHNQFLKGDTLQVWLLPALPGVKQPGQAEGLQQSRRPHRLEATGNVIAKSTDMYVHNTDRLVVNFKDGVVKSNVTSLLGDPTSREVSAANTTDVLNKPPAASGPSTADKGGLISMPGKTGSSPKPDDPNAPAKPPRPIDLSARIIETEVVRVGPKNELDQLRAEGTVRVKQDPATPEDKGVDIRGDTLQLNHFPEGNVLTITGENLAQLRMDKLFILGTEINVDQVKNEARVDKTGAMVIDSDTDFEGNKLGRTVPLTIHWSDHMFFSGDYAEFHGGIQAEQENARLACQTLCANLDRPISLREGNKGDPAKVQDLICDKSVKVRDVTIVNKRIVKDQRLECGVLEVHKNVGTVFARLPGFVRIWQPGQKDPLTAPVPGGRGAAKAGPVPDDAEMKLTYVSFTGWMRADNEKKSASFVDDVKVLHMPATNPDVKIDLDKILNAMPANAFFMKCGKLDIITVEEKGKATKEMTAKDRVIIQGPDYSGRAALVTYNEAKEQIILQGGENGKARLYKYKGPGIKPDEIVAKKIIYSRITGEHSTDGTEKFEGRP